MKAMIRSLVLGLCVLACEPLFAAGTGGCTITGPANAPVVIEEFVDFHCLYCEKGSRSMRQALQDFPGKVRLVLRNMPLPGHGAGALTAAKAFAAVCLQGGQLGYKFQEELFDHQQRLIDEGDAYIDEVAARIGVNVAQMRNDMQSRWVADDIAFDQAEFSRHGFKGAPSYVVGKDSVVGARPYSEFKAMIEANLKAAK